MYTPSFKVKKTGVPVLSAKEIENHGERFVADFCPDALTHPQPLDVESFSECYLGMTPDYQYLSHNGVYLGMTVFNDTDKVVVYSPETKRAEYIHAKPRTMIIDNSLLVPEQAHRYRFTVIHETGHDIFHSAYFAYNRNQQSFFPVEDIPMVRCRRDNCSLPQNQRLWTDNDWMEWHSNKFSSVFLMPKKAVALVANDFGNVKGPENNVAKCRLIAEISRTFDVSIAAASIRLKDLGYIAKDDTTDYSMVTAINDFAGLFA